MKLGPILPGATIGFLGGGQLGRMSALAARSMGYDVHVLDPEANCATRPLASRTVTAPFDDVDAAVSLAKGCDVVTLEIEQIHPDVLSAVAEHAPLHPGRAPLFVIQERRRQKQWLEDSGFPVGAFATARSADEMTEAVRRFGPSIAKSTQGGYDGRGQVRLASPEEASAAWHALGARTCVVEQRVDIDFEISVLVARRPSGAVAVYPPSRNFHTNGILTWAVAPACVDDALRAHAQQLAIAIAERLELVGLLAVEYFVTTSGTLLVNELAPRPHNSYHHSERGFATSQFEQIIRAVCDLPLGSTAEVTPCAIVNLLGDVWLHDTPPAFSQALEVPGTRLHLYGKAGARAGRKMGHVSAVGATAQEAVSRALASYRILSPTPSDSFDVRDPVLPAR